MSAPPRLVTAGRIGRPHALEGAFRVEAATEALIGQSSVSVAGAQRLVERRAGTEARPILRLAGICDREAAAALRGELLLVEETEEPLEEGEWLAADLEGCLVPGLGRVTRVLGAPSCEVLELDDGTLVPLISDAVTSVDVAGRIIEVDRRFLGREEEPG